MRAPNPTAKAYKSLDDAFAFFNRQLFGGRLPPCLITMQRSKAAAYGYFAGGRFGSKDGKEITDEIALNPSHFHERSTEQSLSTLVHEMAQTYSVSVRMFDASSKRYLARSADKTRVEL
jgi:hypothetical protein